MDKEKYKHTLKSVVASKDVIPSIFNYCDRWCERCTHSSRCSMFKVEQEMNYSNEELDIQNQQFWNTLSDIFKATAELMHEAMQEMDIELDKDIPADDFISKSISSEMVVVSRNYALDVAKWLDSNRDEIQNRFNILKNISIDKALQFSETVDVIQHYFMLIATKTYRASLVFDDTDDARGSAKVTIIVIDRSIAAWMALLNDMPTKEDDILKFLKALSKVKELILTTFPTAMAFVRPGFDE